MDELKTLKEIYLPSDGCCCENNIRTEAIKWVKNLKQRGYEMEVTAKVETSGELLKHLTVKSDYFMLTSWIENFFNITKEELK